MKQKKKKKKKKKKSMFYIYVLKYSYLKKSDRGTDYEETTISLFSLIWCEECVGEV